MVPSGAAYTWFSPGAPQRFIAATNASGPLARM
jgi:hypothetical protein